jgi:hypothetical protein
MREINATQQAALSDWFPVLKPTAPGAAWTNEVWRLHAHGVHASPYGAGMRMLAGCRHSDWNLARIAFHEAGHEAVARAFDLNPHVELYADGSGMCFFAERSVQQGRLVGLAGYCAERIAEDGSAAVEAGAVFTLISRNIVALSESDARLVHGFNRTDLDWVLAILKGRWPVVARLAGFAITDFLTAQGVPPALKGNHAVDLHTIRQGGPR